MTNGLKKLDANSGMRSPEVEAEKLASMIQMYIHHDDSQQKYFLIHSSILAFLISFLVGKGETLSGFEYLLIAVVVSTVELFMGSIYLRLRQITNHYHDLVTNHSVKLGGHHRIKFWRTSTSLFLISLILSTGACTICVSRYLGQFQQA